MAPDQLPLVGRELAGLVQNSDGMISLPMSCTSRRCGTRTARATRSHRESPARTRDRPRARSDPACTGPSTRSNPTRGARSRGTAARGAPRAVEIHHLARDGELGEDAVAAVEMDERIAQTSLLAARLGVLARRLRRQQEVASLDGDLLCALEVRFGGRQLARLARDRSEMLLDLAGDVGLRRLRRERARRLAGRRRGDEVPARDLERGALRLDPYAFGEVAERLGHLRRLVERAGGVLPSLQVDAELTHTAQGAEHLLGDA